MIENDRISRTSPTGSCPDGDYDKIIDATGCFVLPGIIDTHVHFREPGLTAKADIESESRAAACGGVTSYCEMPNTVPQTTTLETLEEKFHLAADHSHVNYSFYFGATNGNAALFRLLDRHRVPAIKLFMGASTGNMLVDKYGSLLDIFRSAKRHHIRQHGGHEKAIRRRPQRGSSPLDTQRGGMLSEQCPGGGIGPCVRYPAPYSPYLHRQGVGTAPSRGRHHGRSGSRPPMVYSGRLRR